MTVAADLLAAIEADPDDEGPQLVIAPDGFPQDLELASSDEWTEREASVILTLISDAIRAGTPLADLRFPFASNPLPSYDGGPMRGYHLPEDFTALRGLARNRYGLAARDYQRWHSIWHRLLALENRHG